MADIVVKAFHKAARSLQIDTARVDHQVIVVRFAPLHAGIVFIVGDTVTVDTFNLRFGTLGRNAVLPDTAFAGTRGIGITEYPYHADDEACEIYNAQDIITIYSTLSMLKTSQITYQNQLKQYVKNLKSIEEVQAIVYGQELTGEYLESYNTLMTSAQSQLAIVLSKFTVQGE